MIDCGKKVIDYPFKYSKNNDALVDFFYPKEDKNSSKPIVIYMHGGGWSEGSKEKISVALFKRIAQKLLERGFLIASVGYRKGDEYSIRDCCIDCKDAIRFIVQKKDLIGVNTDKIFLFGDSSGGHIAQLLSLKKCPELKGQEDLYGFKYKVAGTVSWYGPVEFGDPELFLSKKDRFEKRIMKGSSAGEKESRYNEISPIRHATKEDNSMLLIHGDSDTTIPLVHSEMMSEKTGCKKIVVENAGHNFRNKNGDIKPSRSDIVKKTVNFFCSKI